VTGGRLDAVVAEALGDAVEGNGSDVTTITRRLARAPLALRQLLDEGVGHFSV
jgi:hypothetical protein